MGIYDHPGVRLRLEVRMDGERRGDRDAILRVRGARTSLTTGYGRFITAFSFDASAGGNGSATTTPSRTPTRLPR